MQWLLQEKAAQRKQGFRRHVPCTIATSKMPRPLRPFFGFRKRRVRRCRVLLVCLHARVRENCGQLAPPKKDCKIHCAIVASGSKSRRPAHRNRNVRSGTRGFRALGNVGFESRSRSNNEFQVRTCTSRTSRTSSARELTGSSALPS